MSVFTPKNFLTLTKFRISVVSMMTTFLGFVLAMTQWDWKILPTLAGVCLLAMGASALNQWQEIEIDRRMPRTKNRPLPQGLVRPASVLSLSFFLIVSGSAFLFPVAGFLVGMLGLLTVLSYNGIYVYLKRVSSFAAVPGGLVGALPPYLGWVAAGGSPWAPQGIALAIFFFLWQIPHFWTLQLYLGREYKMAGLPDLFVVFSARQIQRVTFVWNLTTAFSVILFPLFSLGEFRLTWFLIFFLSVFFVYHTRGILSSKLDKKECFHLFMKINIFMLMVEAVLLVDRFIFLMKLG